MRLTIDDFKTEHYQLLAELAKALQFKVVEVELNEDEEDAYLIAAMEEVKGEPNLSKSEAHEFENWLKSVAKNHE